MKLKILLSFFSFLQCCLILSQTTYIENFNSKGYPTNLPNGGYWKFYNEIHPSQDIWDKFIPGDGFAYIKVDADINNDTDPVHPYQTMVFGGGAENHRIEVRMKGAVVDGGLVAFLFTYHQTGSIFNEVDIEVVANDRDVEPHDIYPSNGWTDARFNTWRNADENTGLPISGSAKAVVNQANDKISLLDDNFHTYTIDWRSDQVDFFIDGVLQESFTTNVATGWAEIIIGYRNLPWANDFKWTGTHTLVIDYFKIEPLETLSTNFLNQKNNVSIFPNPVNNEIEILIPENQEIKKMELVNILSSKVVQVIGNKKKINVSSLPKGVYFLKILFKNDTQFSKKIFKL